MPRAEERNKYDIEQDRSESHSSISITLLLHTQRVCDYIKPNERKTKKKKIGRGQQETVDVFEERK